MPNTQDPLFSYSALKEKMEKDLDDISKIAQGLKGKLEALDKAVHEYLSFTNSLIVIFFYIFVFTSSDYCENECRTISLAIEILDLRSYSLFCKMRHC